MARCKSRPKALICDVGGCLEEGIYTFNEFRICGEHFGAYLREEFDLIAYFCIQRLHLQGLSLNDVTEQELLGLMCDEEEGEWDLT